MVTAVSVTAVRPSLAAMMVLAGIV
jgi:hypothetical protein